MGWGESVGVSRSASGGTGVTLMSNFSYVCQTVDRNILYHLYPSYSVMLINDFWLFPDWTD
jgi:hypothetical protein